MEQIGYMERQTQNYRNKCKCNKEGKFVFRADKINYSMNGIIVCGKILKRAGKVVRTEILNKLRMGRTVPWKPNLQTAL